MKKTAKRFIAVILTLTMLISGCCLTTAMAAANESNLKPISAEDFKDAGL